MHSRENVINRGDKLSLTIESLNHQGEGVGRYKGMAVFVPFTVPGEEVLARITQLKKNYATAEVLEITTRAQTRVEASCPAYETCGGSRLQHIDYELQLKLKEQMVTDAMRRIGKLTDVVVKPTIGMAKPWGYRNKAHFQVSMVEGQIRLGFFEEATHNIVPTTECLLLDTEIRAIAAMVEESLNKLRPALYDWKSGKGLMRHVVIRRSRSTSKIMVVLVTSGEKFPEQETFAQEIMDKAPEIVSVVRNINTGPTRQVLGGESRVLAGVKTLTDEIGGLNFNISPTSFFQVNSGQAEVMYEKALEYAGLTGTETVLDVYCGIGTISLLLAQNASRVYGFEVLKEAVQDAAANAKRNNIANVEFVAGKAEEQLPKLIEQGVKPDVIVVDPPRQGVEKRALEVLAKMNPSRIVYISCDPATMARDVNFLSSRGYSVKEVQPVDMFPQTSHVECVVLIQRKKCL